MGARQPVGLQSKVVAGTDAAHPFEGAGHRHAIDAVDPRQRRPEAVFVAPAHPAQEIDAPGLRRRHPRTAACGTGWPFPRTSPVAPTCVFTFQMPSQLLLMSRPSFTIWASHFAPERVGREPVAVPLVVERVENHLERIAGGGIEILLEVTDDDVVWRRVVGVDADVEIRVVVQHRGLRSPPTPLHPRAARSGGSRWRSVRRARRPRRAPRQSSWAWTS